MKHPKALGLDITPADITQEDGFTKKQFASPGYPVIKAMDFMAQKGAACVHDLNLPLRPELQGQRGPVIDGRTTAHIFHIGTALDTRHQLLKPGGILVSFVAADGWSGHGFFPTGPDVP